MLLRYADKRIVNKIYYNESVHRKGQFSTRINIDRCRKKCWLYSRLLLRSDGFDAISPLRTHTFDQEVSNANHFGCVFDTLGWLAVVCQGMASIYNIIMRRGWVSGYRWYVGLLLGLSMWENRYMPPANTCLHRHCQTVTCHRAVTWANVTISVVMVTTWLGDSNLCLEYRWLMTKYACCIVYRVASCVVIHASHWLLGGFDHGWILG